jgi:hypothetical protein
MPSPHDPYDRHRGDAADRSRDKSARGREIGPLPPAADPARKEACGKSLRLFCETYFPNRFYLGWSPAHLRAIERLQQCVLTGGRFALAMPRGSGKTTLCEVAALWALAYGYRRFVVIVGAAGEHAERTLAKLQAEVETNDRLAADFPEVCHPVRRLEGIHNRAKGQTLNGERTRIGWTADGIRLPTVKGFPSSGAVVKVAGLTGSVRGLSELDPDGRPFRPDLVLLDDPQTRGSAKSITQTHDRERIILGDVLGLAGPTTTIAAVMPCTVIYPKDLAARFLDREARPEWQGERTKMLVSFPANLELWDRYKELRDRDFAEGGDGSAATAFYLENREAMDAGAEASWPDRFKDGEVSAVQSAMNWFLTDRREFMAEGQNEPEPEGGLAGAKELRADLVAARLSGVPRLSVPREAARVTAFVDCGKGLHWYCVCAWDAAFGGSVIDYGSWPRQARAVFAADDPRPAMAEVYPNRSETQVLYAGLADVANHVLGRVYYRDGAGDELRCERLLVDAGWQSQTVYQWCRESPHAGVIHPSKGIARTTTSRGVSEWKPRPGERAGFHWRLTTTETGKGRMVQFDPDAWKTFLYERLTTEPGGAGRLALFGRSAADHELLAEHCAAEQAEAVTIRGTTFDKWQVLPHRPDNHLWDCLVGCAVAASVQGSVWSPSSVAPVARPGKKKLSIEEMYQAAQKRQGAGNGT